MRRVIVSPQARAELDEIEDYISADSPRAARRVVDDLVEAIDGLRTDAHVHGHHPAIGPRLRRLKRYDYLIFFVVRDDEVDIVGVIHGKRDLLAALEGRLPR